MALQSTSRVGATDLFTVSAIVPLTPPHCKLTEWWYEGWDEVLAIKAAKGNGFGLPRIAKSKVHMASRCDNSVCKCDCMSQSVYRKFSDTEHV